MQTAKQEVGKGPSRFNGDPHSSIVDAQSTMVLNNRIVKILAWYDNEWGYSARLVDFAEFMAGKGLFTEKE